MVPQYPLGDSKCRFFRLLRRPIYFKRFRPEKNFQHACLFRENINNLFYICLLPSAIRLLIFGTAKPVKLKNHGRIHL